MLLLKAGGVTLTYDPLGVGSVETPGVSDLAGETLPMGRSSSAIEEREFRSFLDFLFLYLFLLREADETELESPSVSPPGGSMSGRT